MKKYTSNNNYLINETLIGGASLSLSDLELVQSREIKWLNVSSERSDIDRKDSLAA
tara:strand:+ start:376 stop:543 length:168 start_codon:yes stop_codon:yes gene_type:complete